LFKMLFMRLHQRTKSMMGISETSFVNAINLSLFTLVSDRLFRKGQDVVTFFTKITQVHSLGHILKFSTETSCLGQACTIQITLRNKIFYIPTKIALCAPFKAFHCFPNPKSQNLHRFKQKHGQAYHSNTLVPGTNFCLRVLLL
jgi:hypothetical protein